MKMTGEVDAATGEGREARGRNRAPPSIRVLHVEDDDLVASLVAHILDQPGADNFRVFHFSSLHDAWPALNDAQPNDVLLLDLNLPDSRGWTTFKKIRGGFPYLPLVILTGDPDEELAVKAVAEGAQDYLLKSEIKAPGLLARILHYAVDRQSYLQQIEMARRLLMERNNILQQTLKSLERTNAALVESEKIKSLGQMAAGLAHELKNPLAILRMGFDYLENAAPEKQAAAIGKILPDLNKALDRASGILDDLMDYSAPRSPNPEMMSLNSLINEAVEIMRPLLLKQGIELSTNLSEAIPDLALDRKKILQVVLNLIGNAAQAMPQGGRLRITTFSMVMNQDETRPANGDDIPAPLLVTAEIHDTGSGIPIDVLPRVFDPFFTTKSGNGGTGLGLAVGNMIMDLHGGKLDLANHPDGGAVARMIFVA